MASSIPWTKIKALSFDIYGTLVDREDGAAAAARATALGSYLPKSHKELMHGIDMHDQRIQREKPTMKQSDIIAEGLQCVAKDLRIVESGNLTQAQVDQACKEYGGKMGSYSAFPDTVAAIQRLGKRYKLIPLSNVDHDSFNGTLSGPLKGCNFDAIYVAEDIGSYKPDLKNFHYLLDHAKQDLGIEKDQLVHVAQSLFHDHGPAQQMGLWHVWVDRKGLLGGEEDNAQERFGYQLRVETLAELADIVEKAFSEA